MPPPIAASIDLEAPGKRIGHLELAWSDDEHAYGVIPVPIAVIANGSGPSVLVTAGVHGDEYEGQVIARRLIAELAAARSPGASSSCPASTGRRCAPGAASRRSTTAT